MNVIALSSAAWRYNKTQSLCLIKRFISENEQEFVVITKSAVEREVATDNEYNFKLVHIVDFIDMGTSPDGVLNVHKIRELPYSATPEQKIIVNASGTRLHLIESFISQCRHAWYELETWHPAFIVILDDSILLDIATPLAKTFYIQPIILTEPELRAKVISMMRVATILRYFGHKVGRIQKIIFAYFNRIDRRNLKKGTDL